MEYDWIEATAILDGKLVEGFTVQVRYEEPNARLSMAEYLARRELAADYLAHWRNGGTLERIDGDAPWPAAALMVAGYTLHLCREVPPPRSKKPLPLP